MCFKILEVAIHTEIQQSGAAMPAYVGEPWGARDQGDLSMAFESDKSCSSPCGGDHLRLKQRVSVFRDPKSGKLQASHLDRFEQLQGSMKMQLVSFDFCFEMEFGSQKSPIQSVHMIHFCLDHRNPMAVSGLGIGSSCGTTGRRSRSAKPVKSKCKRLQSRVFLVWAP